MTGIAATVTRPESRAKPFLCRIRLHRWKMLVGLGRTWTHRRCRACGKDERREVSFFW